MAHIGTKKVNIKKLKISQIKPYFDNAKIHTEHQVQLIKDSINRVGYYNPIVVGTGGVIIAGHGRFEAMRLIKGVDDEIDVVDLSNLSIEAQDELRIYDNKVSSSDYDPSLLMKEVRRLEKINAENGGDILDLESRLAMEIFTLESQPIPQERYDDEEKFFAGNVKRSVKIDVDEDRHKEISGLISQKSGINMTDKLLEMLKCL